MTDGQQVINQRVSGILLHPTSLPGPYGVGDLGSAAYRFVDFLAAAGQRRWQILPLGPPGYGNSPYQSISSMAGNPLLISLDALAADGWISPDDLREAPSFPREFVNFPEVRRFKYQLLRKAAAVFHLAHGGDQGPEFEAFCHEKKFWLDKFAEFMTAKDATDGEVWTHWQAPRLSSENERAEHQFIQFEFFRQWRRLKMYCNQKGIEIIGDIPIFVAHDSADVWSHPHLFDLDHDGNPRTIAGVPPDYFSATGQCWGNPLYRWERMADTGYTWWIERVRAALELVDWVRLDHFRGFEQYYEIPGGATTAVKGRWMPGPGDALFTALTKALGKLPFLAEDLGMITPEVEALRDRWEFPGMVILQFAFDDDPRNRFKPYNHVENCVVYTGTHDNDTIVGWLTGSGEESTRSAESLHSERQRALRYVNSDRRAVHWDFIRTALMSVANTAIIPLQDALGLGSEARMNLPGRSGDFWRWRALDEQLTPALAERLRTITELYGRG
ncbi:MAG: 4-alpha-glucanotransferase [Acidobacteria bacterium]|nr:4-alpha-glucanotransferase [Acidobacteriota bacterium]MBI3657063.1 4-alpha-glucanotransferase [Acidobacteriota bacterium]